MEIEFRKAKKIELNKALDFFKLASSTLASKKVNQWAYWQDPPQDKVDWVAEGFKNEEFVFVFDRLGNQIAMFRLLAKDLLYWDEKGSEEGVRYIHSLVVPPAYAGQGIGKAVILKIIDQLKEEKITKFRLDCDASNQRLCQYYEGYGFLKVGQKTTNYSVNNLYEMCLT